MRMVKARRVNEHFDTAQHPAAQYVVARDFIKGCKSDKA